MDERTIEEMCDEIKDRLRKIEDPDKKISVLNEIRKSLSEESPLRHHPVDCVLWVKTDTIEGNDYNPNHVDRQNMKLLIHSIEEDGYTMPIVGCPEYDIIRIVDGFHRRKSILTSKKISESTNNHVPVSLIRDEKKDLKNRMASTVRHNRARGVHHIESMSDMVVDLIQDGWGDSEIALHLGMDADEVLRLKQTSGISGIFENLNYSQSWEFKEVGND